VVAEAHDATGRKRAEDATLAMERRLLHAQKLESLGVLAGGIAHDFNNILAGIMGYADLSILHLPSMELVRADVEVIKKAAQRAADLTRQMLAYSGNGNLIVAPLSLSQVVEDTKQILAMSVSKKASLTYDLAADLPAIQADAGQIGQVIMNLVINASESLGEQGGVISISTDAIQCSAQDLAAMGCGTDVPVGLYVRLGVADSGCGMDQQTLGKIFEPFFTTKFTGRGLGLAAVYGIVQGHKGALRVSSQPGQGTSFQVLFPAAADASLPTVPRAAGSPAWRGSGTVLVVDDEDTIRNAAREMLEELGFVVLAASDGREAVALYRQYQREIVCVLLDLTMPKMDGEETFRNLRRIRRDVRVILSSGYSEEGVTERFAGMDLAGFIQKPYQLATLVAQFRKALEGGRVYHAPRTASAAAMDPASVPCQSAGRTTVLVVDDHELVRKSTQLIFQRAGFPVLTAQDGDEAVRVYRGHQEKIACVYLDLAMPRMGGEETLRELRLIDAQVRVIIASGYPRDEVAQRFAGQGVWRFFHKLDPLDDLIAELRAALAEADRPGA
jgi:CheY-like chemotaxis protein/nitrogen-specific signal transduction histidine kinase